MTRAFVLAFLLCPWMSGAGVHAQAGSPAARPASADWVLPGSASTLPAALAQALGGIHAPALAVHVGLLASDAFEGRGLGSRGLEAAAEYAAASLALAGVPAAGTREGPTGKADLATPYFQPVPLREISHPAGQVIIETRHGASTVTRAFLSGVDCLFPEVPPGTVEGAIVFAGYGIRETEPARDDYSSLDVRGRIVAILGGVPPGADWQAKDVAGRWAARSGRARFAAKAELAASLGARAVIAIEGDEFDREVGAGDQGPAPLFYAPFDVEGAAPALPAVVRVSPRVGAQMLAAADLQELLATGAAPRELPGTRATIRIAGDERLVEARNVIGVIAGADPKLRAEAVVIGTHLDHLGRVDGTLYPGADDNASGTAALLEIARAFAASSHRPRRSLVFAFWTGEEEGKLGSGYYVRHPAWPLERTAAYLNLDMIGHPWTAKELAQLVDDAGLARDQGGDALRRMDPSNFIELGVADSAPSLGPVLQEAARGTGLALHLDWTDGKNGGSDYRDFARRGLPFVRFFGNYFEGYHEPSDRPEALDVRQVLKMTRLAFATAWLLADR